MLDLQFGLNGRLVDLVEAGIDVAVRVGELRDFWADCVECGPNSLGDRGFTGTFVGRPAIRRPAGTGELRQLLLLIHG